MADGVRHPLDPVQLTIPRTDGTRRARSPRILVLSAPSGGGKTTLARELVSRWEHYRFSVSATTRPPRMGEIDGVHYHFLDESAFKKLADQGMLMEWAVVHGHWYGTPLSNLDSARRRNDCLILDIDVQGATRLKASIVESMLIFVLPPSAEAMVQRLKHRGSEGARELHSRLRTALGELEQIDQFDAVVVNDSIEGCAAKIQGIAQGLTRGLSIREIATRVSRLSEDLEKIILDLPADMDSAIFATPCGTESPKHRRPNRPSSSSP